MTPQETLLVTLALIAPVAAQSRDWPCFRGPDHNGVARDGNPPTTFGSEQNLAWRTELPGPGASSPIVLGDRVYVTCYSGFGSHLDDGGDKAKLTHHLVCVWRENGKVVFDKTVPGPLETDPPKIQISSHGFASPTPATDGKAIFAYFGHAGVVAFDPEGKILWQADLGKPDPKAPKRTNAVRQKGKELPLRWGSAASPVLHENLVIVNASEQSNSIRALDKQSGELVWKYESANLEGCASTPAVVGEGDDAVAVISLGGAIWGLGAKDGKMRWLVETRTIGGMSPTPVVRGDVVFAFGGMGSGFALKHAGEDDPKTLKERLAPTDLSVDVENVQGPEAKAPEVPDNPRIVWKGADNLDVPSPVLHDGKLFLVDSKGMFACVDAKNGDQLQKGRLEGRTGGVYASPVIAGGHLYVVTRKRGVFVYALDVAPKKVARCRFEGDDSKFDASPAISGDAMFLRSNRYLYGIAASRASETGPGK